MEAQRQAHEDSLKTTRSRRAGAPEPWGKNHIASVIPGLPSRATLSRPSGTLGLQTRTPWRPRGCTCGGGGGGSEPAIELGRPHPPAPSSRHTQRAGRKGWREKGSEFGLQHLQRMSSAPASSAPRGDTAGMVCAARTARACGRRRRGRTFSRGCTCGGGGGGSEPAIELGRPHPPAPSSRHTQRAGRKGWREKGSEFGLQHLQRMSSAPASSAPRGDTAGMVCAARTARACGRRRRGRTFSRGRTCGGGGGGSFTWRPRRTTRSRRDPGTSVPGYHEPSLRDSGTADYGSSQEDSEGSSNRERRERPPNPLWVPLRGTTGGFPGTTGGCSPERQGVFPGTGGVIPRPAGGVPQDHRGVFAREAAASLAFPFATGKVNGLGLHLV